jgi:hypothetical protein
MPPLSKTTARLGALVEFEVGFSTTIHSQRVAIAFFQFYVVILRTDSASAD